MTQQQTSLTRTLRVGDSVSFDNERIVVRVERHSGLKVRLNIHMDPQVKVDKPPKPPEK